MAIFERSVRVDISKVNGNGLITNKGMLSLMENVACMHSDVAGYRYYGYSKDSSILGSIKLES